MTALVAAVGLLILAGGLLALCLGVIAKDADNQDGVEQ